jgi:hypothetical protein
MPPAASTGRNAAIALALGSIGGVVTMAFHPTGHDLLRNASGGVANTKIAAAHTLALVSQPLLLAGTLALTLRLRARRDLAVMAYVFFAVATVAVTIAAVASGYMAPSAVRGYAQADEAGRAMMHHSLHYTGLVNQAFAKLYIAFAGVAIALWSVAAVGSARELPRPLAAYGLVLGGALVAAIAAGLPLLSIHGFGLVVLGQATWMMWLAAVLWRAESGISDSPSPARR